MTSWCLTPELPQDSCVSAAAWARTESFWKASGYKGEVFKHRVGLCPLLLPHLYPRGGLYQYAEIDLMFICWPDWSVCLGGVWCADVGLLLRILLMSTTQRHRAVTVFYLILQIFTCSFSLCPPYAPKAHTRARAHTAIVIYSFGAHDTNCVPFMCGGGIFPLQRVLLLEDLCQRQFYALALRLSLTFSLPNCSSLCLCVPPLQLPPPPRSAPRPSCYTSAAHQLHSAFVNRPFRHENAVTHRATHRSVASITPAWPLETSLRSFVLTSIFWSVWSDKNKFAPPLL